MTNFIITLAYNFGSVILALIILTIIFNYFYLKSFKKSRETRVHTAQSKKSYWKGVAEDQRVSLVTLREENKLLVESITFKQLDKVLAKMKSTKK